jgi:hypothetical protein
MLSVGSIRQLEEKLWSPCLSFNFDYLFLFTHNFLYFSIDLLATYYMLRLSHEVMSPVAISHIHWSFLVSTIKCIHLDLGRD